MIEPVASLGTDFETFVSCAPVFPGTFFPVWAIESFLTCPLPFFLKSQGIQMGYRDDQHFLYIVGQMQVNLSECRT